MAGVQQCSPLAVGRVRQWAGPSETEAPRHAWLSREEWSKGQQLHALGQEGDKPLRRVAPKRNRPCQSLLWQSVVGESLPPLAPA